MTQSIGTLERQAGELAGLYAKADHRHRVDDLLSRISNLQVLILALSDNEGAAGPLSNTLARTTLLTDRLVVETQNVSEQAFKLLEEVQVKSNVLKNQQIWAMSALVVLLVALNLVLVLNFKRRVLKPLMDIQEVAQKVSFGHINERVEIRSNDELGELGKSVNCMAVSLASQIHEANQINDQLEQKFKEHESTNEHLRAVVSQLRSTAGVLDATGSMAGVGGWTYNLETEELTWSPQTYVIAQAPRHYTPVLEEAFALYDGPEAQQAITHAIEHCIQTHEKIDIELPFVTMKGKHIWVQVYGEVMHERVQGVLKPKLLIGAFQDITERRARKRQLEEALEKATNASSAKSEFLANMSHEIRTPLNGVIGLCYLLRNTRLSTDQKELVSKLEASGQSLLSLVSGILDLSKIESGMTQLDSVKFSLHQ
ncbi:MAG: histidine kinase dimerization/phospho-acceptor domain-containing protein, partial [Limnobacter sp.]|nr:histidine kinase dimerization/phospho-acceptor domain-containing protein [Limnobacter sp.]